MSTRTLMHSVRRPSSGIAVRVLIVLTLLLPLALVGASAGTGRSVATPAGSPGSAQVPIEPLPVAVLPPEFDPFYQAPANSIVDTPPGGIIKARQITPSFLALLPLNIDAWQLLYRTNDSHGNPIATVTTVLEPRGPAPDGGRKLFSYQEAEDSTAKYCAMSYVIQQGSIPVDWYNNVMPIVMIALGLSQGWAMAIPDYEGPNSVYGGAVLGGQATLDGIRAAEGFAPMELAQGAGTPVVMAGYSGGTIPTGWAAEHRQTYAPELNIVGATIGGVVMGDLAGLLRHNSGGLFAGLVGTAFYSFAAEYPEVRQVLDSQLDWFGRFMITFKSMLCKEEGTVTFPGWNYLGSFTGQGDLLENPVLESAMHAQELGQQTPDVPMYIYHAQNDEIIPIAGTDRVVDGYCRDQNAKVVYTREFLTEHITGGFAWAPKGFQFLIDRMNGVPMRPGCTIDNPTSTFTDGDFLRLLTDKVPALAALIAGFPLGAGIH
ncbi:lipase family protein [Nocardia arthritidis]|nr:lipase family protein [Nocardia arthritidis]